MVFLNELAQDCLRIAKRREQKGQLKSDTFSILKHCAGEVCEAVDAYSRLAGSDDEILDELLEEQYADELADIIACVLIVCANEPTINIEKAMQDCLEKNLAKTKKIDGIDNYEKFTFGSN